MFTKKVIVSSVLLVCIYIQCAASGPDARHDVLCACAQQLQEIKGLSEAKVEKLVCVCADIRVA